MSQAQPTALPRSNAELRLNLTCVIATLYHRAQQGPLAPEEVRAARHVEDALEELDKLAGLRPLGARPSSTMSEAGLSSVGVAASS